MHICNSKNRGVLSILNNQFIKFLLPQDPHKSMYHNMQ